MLFFLAQPLFCSDFDSANVSDAGGCWLRAPEAAPAAAAAGEKGTGCGRSRLKANTCAQGRATRFVLLEAPTSEKRIKRRCLWRARACCLWRTADFVAADAACLPRLQGIGHRATAHDHRMCRRGRSQALPHARVSILRAPSSRKGGDPGRLLLQRVLRTIDGLFSGTQEPLQELPAREARHLLYGGRRA